MGDDDKPFECSHCRMQFVNEDHLSVHKERHKFVLNLNTSTPKICLASEISDQTPTPTRFIKNCEDVGLFSDLQANPFDEQFRRASQSGTDGLVNNSSQQTESLNTPYIPLFTSDILPSKSFLNDDADLKIKAPSVEVDSDTNPFPIIPLNTPTLQISTKKYDTIKTSQDTLRNKVASPKVLNILSATKTENPGQTSVITSVGMKHKLIGKPTAVVVKPKSTSTATTGILRKVVTKTTPIAPTTVSNNVSAESTTVTQSSQGTVLQFILKLADGKTMPFNVVPVNGSTGTQNIVTVAAPSAGTSTIQMPSPTKMKLRDTIEQQISLKTSVAPVLTSSGLTVKPKTSLTNMPFSSQSIIPTIGSVINQNVAAIVPTVRTSNNTNLVTMGRKKKEEEEDPDEKRRKFLERNRAAATRCRKKRKAEFDEMKTRANELAKVNDQLQTMVAMLRKEVAQLKSMLLAHKDCPVTQQQLSAGQPNVMSLCSMTMSLHAISNNQTFQAISGLTSNDNGGMEVECVTDDILSQKSSSNLDSLMENLSNGESSNESSAFLEHC